MTGSLSSRFATAAYLCANKARLGACTMRDRLALAILALELPPVEEAARRAVWRFQTLVDVAPGEAGAELRAFADQWARAAVPQEIPATSPDWSGRKDCGHD